MVDLKQGLEFGKPAGPQLSTYVCRLPLDPLSTTPYNNPSPPVAMFRSYQGVPCVSQPELGFAQFGATDGNFQDPSANLPPASLPPTKPPIAGFGHRPGVEDLRTYGRKPIPRCHPPPQTR